ncbi:MAG: helix-turn-helix transcriptional regulator [Acetobacteraceae bacterium]|nr:helix-turn-helix transcriptional regulator [Acetobacteraceae bacterium]
MPDLLAGIQRLYDGLWDAASWQDGLDEVCAGLRAHHVVAVSPAAGGVRDDKPLCWGAHIAVEALEREARAMMTIAAGMRVGVAMDTAEVVPDRELFRSRIYTAFIQPMGGHYGMTASPFPGSLLAVCRPPTARRFAHSEIKGLQAALPHLQAALRLKRHLLGVESHAAALEGALDALGVGVLIAARSGRVLYANRSAEATLRTMPEADGSAAPSGRLREVVGQPDGRRHAIPRGLSRRPVVVRAVPVSGRAAERLLPNSECQVAVFLRDPDRREDTTRADLTASLGLTPREASLAELLARDATLADAAAALGITRENARVHLKRIFSKTETRRQAELVSLILRLTA